jgi:hypothetical protein
VFTALYGLSPYIERTLFVIKGKYPLIYSCVFDQPLGLVTRVYDY